MKIDPRSPLLEVGRELRRISGPAEPKSAAIGMEGQRAEVKAYQAPVDLEPSPALSIVGKAKSVLKGRKIGALVTDGADGDRLQALRDALEREGAELAIVAPKIGGVRLKSGKHLATDMALSGAPSVFFDAVAIFASVDGDQAASQEQRCDRLGSRRFRASQSYWLYASRAASVRKGEHCR